ncbi:MAG: AAA family ATPase [Dehalococcoidales bacterium]|nr:AAA family ATPase [Dehalococcoidales bacterium]
MAHDVFISYSVEDKAIVDAVVAILEGRRIRCWVAPRDVMPGQDFAEAIIDAINNSHAVIVVLSSASNNSQYVYREVERAVSKAIPIVTLRIEDVVLSKAMELYLSSTHWLDAVTPPIEEHLEKLADILKRPESIDLLETMESPSQQATSIAEDRLNRQVFIGRERELRQLKASYDKAVLGQGTLVTIEGEPGIGKSSLCEKLAMYVSLHGGNVLHGHCEKMSIPYLPFVEAIRSHVLTNGVSDLSRKPGTTAAYVARIVPEMKHKMKIKLSPLGDPQEERYRLMQAVSDFLTTAAISKPLLVILEDLHDADTGSLDMLTHFSRGLAKAPLLLIGTYRDTELARNQPLSEALTEIQRIPNYQRIKLRKLNAEEVMRMIRALSGQKVSPDLAKTIHEKTEGNPLFVRELVRYLAEKVLDDGGEKGVIITEQMVRETGIPKEVHGIISKRLSKLSPECNRVLSLGAVIGREFRIELLKRLAQISDDELFSTLREAKGAMVLEEYVKVGTEVTYRFSHDFFRKTIYEEIIAPERINIHQRVAQAIESMCVTHLEEHAVELTEHFSHSSNADDLAKAVTYGEMAAKQAHDVYAHAEAIRLLEHTLKVQEALAPADRAKRCDLLISLSDALINAGDTRRVLDVEAPKAWALAEFMQDTERSSRICHLAMLALFYYGTNIAWASPEAALWAERAKSVAKPGTIASAQADTALGIVKCSNRHWEEGIPILARAIESARSLGDINTYWWAASWWLMWASGYQHADEILKLAEELYNSSRNSVSTGVLSWALVSIGDTFLDYARRSHAEEVWHELRNLAQRNGQTRYEVFSMTADAMFATIDGDLEQALNIIDRTTEYAKEMGFTEFAQTPILFAIIRPLLYLGMTENALNISAGHHVDAELLSLAYHGDIAEATQMLEECLTFRYSSRFSEVNEDVLAHKEIGHQFEAFMLETAVVIGYQKAADFLLRRLGTCKSRTTGIFYTTCVDRHLGAAAKLLGRYDEARQYYLRALDVSKNMRFRPENALTRLQIAELILAHFPNEKDQAVEHLNFAVKEFRDMKMKPSLERALNLKTA